MVASIGLDENHRTFDRLCTSELQATPYSLIVKYRGKSIQYIFRLLFLRLQGLNWNNIKQLAQDRADKCKNWYHEDKVIL